MIQTNRTRGNRRSKNAQGIDGIAGAKRRLDPAGDHAAPVADPRRRRQPLGERRHAVDGFSGLPGETSSQT